MITNVGSKHHKNFSCDAECEKFGTNGSEMEFLAVLRWGWYDSALI